MNSQQKRLNWPALLAAFIGPLLGLIASLALRFTTELTVIIVIFSIFMAVVVLLIDFRFNQNNQETKRMYQMYVEKLRQSYPLELVSGHDQVEDLYRRILSSSCDEVLIIGLGVDLSAESWKAEIGDYLEATSSLLKRGVSYNRLQIMEPAPIEWLRYLNTLQLDDDLNKAINVRFIEIEPDFYYHRLFQVFVVDEREACLFVNIEVGSDEEFAITVADPRAVRSLKEHILSVSWPKSRRYTPTQFAQIIDEMEQERLSLLRSKVVSYMKLQAKEGERYLSITATLDEFRKVCPTVPDEYLHEQVRQEAEQVWSQMQKARTNEQEYGSEIIDKWLHNGVFDQGVNHASS